ncbi:MAG: IS3 family transposase [Gammaproteobacteria bacterium]|nr:MAG: IS3 family transposase [Gammaproteobacteria bacterium]
MLSILEIRPSKYYNWQKRRHLETRHNGHIPKLHWLLDWEVDAIVAYRQAHMEEGYRRLTYMMLDEDIVAVSPSSVYRVLKRHNLLLTAWRHEKAKGSGFHQPSRPHHHWHLDISYINFKGTFVFLAALIDGYSRFIVHFEIKLSFEALDIEIMMERARAHYPNEEPVLITDNGPQFIAKEFGRYLQEVGITHRRTRFYYPQSNGKIERFFQTCKNEAVRRQSYLSVDDLIEQVGNYIHAYNTIRLHSSLGYITPNDMLLGRQAAIFEQRREKLKQAQENRKRQRTEQFIFSKPTKVFTRSEEQSQGRARVLYGHAAGQP